MRTEEGSELGGAAGRVVSLRARALGRVPELGEAGGGAGGVGDGAEARCRCRHCGRKGVAAAGEAGPSIRFWPGARGDFGLDQVRIEKRGKCGADLFATLLCSFAAEEIAGFAADQGFGLIRASTLHAESQPWDGQSRWEVPIRHPNR